MTFGEKLQLLRKQRGMSQEQLASQLTVSRQAVSKWELDSSSPEIGSVLQLSKLFGVSTDYLLNDEIESDADISAVKIKENDTSTEEKIKTVFVIGFGIVIIGLFLSFIGWRTYQTELSVGIGFIVQILGIVIFEIMKNKCSKSKQFIITIKFYSVSCWIICPFLALFLSRIALGIYPKPYSHWTALIVPAFFYFVICIIVTLTLMSIKKTKDM